MMTRQFSANGKFLLTGEYLVLHGALALALPTRLGQTLTATVRGTTLRWDAHKPDGPWFSAEIDKDCLEILSCDNLPKAQRLVEILKALRALKPNAFQQGCHFETRLDFDPEWGLGSSSTLIANLAQWAEVDPYQLLRMTFGGSGYDIACATASSPIFYQRLHDQPKVQTADFNPPFKNQLYFVYSGNKQSSSAEVKGFNKSFHKDEHLKDIDLVSEISRKLSTLTQLTDFQACLDLHEEIMSRCLGRLPIKTMSFQDFEGSLKSLGAWGGDFLLAATEWPYRQVKDYFSSKGMETVLKYQDIIIEP